MALIGAELVYSHIPAMTAQMKRKAVEAVARAAHSIEAQAKIDCPVDTGFLRGSIEVIDKDGQSLAPDALEAFVGPSAEYGICVELGTHGRPGKPYLLPAAEAERGSFLSEMERICK